MDTPYRIYSTSGHTPLQAIEAPHVVPTKAQVVPRSAPGKGEVRDGQGPELRIHGLSRGRPGLDTGNDGAPTWDGLDVAWLTTTQGHLGDGLARTTSRTRHGRDGYYGGGLDKPVDDGHMCFIFYSIRVPFRAEPHLVVSRADELFEKPDGTPPKF